MKRILFYITFFAVLASSCAKELEIKPTDRIDESDVFTSDQNIKAALRGAYDRMNSGYLYGGDLQMYSDLLGANGEISWVGTYNQPREVFNKAMLTNNSFILGTWLDAYETINIANNIIANIDKVNEENRNQVKGEALYIRGAMYFELVKLFAQPYSAGNVSSNLGVQMVLEPTVGGVIDEKNYSPRVSVEATYAQIVKDLTDAKGLLGESTGVYASTYAASAQLSRVYLQMENFAGARDEANAAIESGLELEAAYANAFNNAFVTDEDIITVPVTDKDGDNDLFVFYSISDFGARDGDIEINDAHLDLYEANDARLKFFYLDGSDIYRSGKWLERYKYIPVIRIAEMYLTRAEANQRLGTSVGATPQQDLDVITKRAGIGSVPATLANILLQRRLELANEGQKVHDMKRLRQSADGFAYNSPKMVFPIPMREVNASKGVLQQNEGY